MTARAADRTYRIELNPFNSGVLAGRVGVLQVTAGSNLSQVEGPRIADDARSAGYDLITLSADAPVDLSGFVHLGTLEEFAGRADEARRLLGNSRHFNIVPLASDQWPLVETLLAFAAPTRFSRDSRLSPDVVKRHKLALLHTYYQRCPQYTLLAISEARGPLGFQASYVEDDAFVLYELFGDNGVVAGEMLARNLDTLARLEPEVRRVKTLVYSDNHTSRAFFSRLGLQPTGRRTYHYHLWP